MKKAAKQKMYVLIKMDAGIVEEVFIFPESSYDKMRRKFVSLCKEIDPEVDVKELNLDSGHDADDKWVICESAYVQ